VPPVRFHTKKPCLSLLDCWRQEITVNRKLIRTTLADVKAKGRESSQQHDRINGGGSRSGASGGDGGASSSSRTSQHSSSAAAAAAAAAVQIRKRVPPPVETNAEIFYYKKQIDAHTLMVIVLQDGEEIEGTIEWYDRGALKVNRKSAPNLLILKHNVKYMYKADEREGE
jgi:sRNA-binding regulator protein Hfq